jgi:poly-gamma-glutamate synthesis protein (capsule biosynthesis protein)
MTKSKRSSGSGSAGQVILALAGDVMLGRQVREAIATQGYAFPWGDILPAVALADLFLVNLECGLTAETKRWYGSDSKPFHFRADPEMVGVLTAGGVDCVSLANNHIGDFGQTGLLETVRVLDGAGIAHAGAGPDLAAARAPARLQVRGSRIAIFAAADYPAAWMASEELPGMNFLDLLSEESLAPLLPAIRAERSHAEHVIVSLHWGPNMRQRPSASFRAFARRLLDGGADLVWGHSAHVLQGVELSGGRLILYDTGDLIDDYAIDPRLRNDLGGIFLVTLGSAGLVRLEVVPIRIVRCQARLAEAEDAAWTNGRVATLSTELGTTLTVEGSRLVLFPSPGGVQ